MHKSISPLPQLVPGYVIHNPQTEDGCVGCRVLELQDEKQEPVCIESVPIRFLTLKITSFTDTQ